MRWFRAIQGDAIAYVSSPRINASRIGNTLLLDPEKATPLHIAWFAITEIQDDYMVCNQIDAQSGLAGKTVYNVALPYELRKTTYDGASIVYPSSTVAYAYTTSQTRTADDGATSETQRITPEYYVGARLRAVNVETGVNDANGVKVTWEDLNTTGRYFATIS